MEEPVNVKVNDCPLPFESLSKRLHIRYSILLFLVFLLPNAPPLLLGTHLIQMASPMSFVDRLQLDYELEKIGSREPVEINDNVAIARMVLDSTSEATGTNSSIVCFPGATDNEHLVANGIQSLVWGAGESKQGSCYR